MACTVQAEHKQQQGVVGIMVLSYLELEEQLRLVGLKLSDRRTTVAERRKLLAGRPPDIIAKILKYEREHRAKGKK
mgnify:CR=1 FL=1